jgi:putative drug exporter of the RND superfamily
MNLSSRSLDRGLQATVRLAAQRPRTVLACWLLLAALCAVLVVRSGGSAFGTDIERSDGSESVRADALLRAHLPTLQAPDQPNEVLVLHAPDLTVDDADYALAAQALAERLQDLGSGVIAGGRSYFMDGDAALVSADRHTTLVPLVLVDPRHQVQALRDAVQAAAAGGPLTVTLVGSASVGLAYRDLADSDLRAELRVGVPAAVVVLLLVFGSVVAASLPLLVAAVSITVALALVVLVAQFTPVYFLVVNMVLMMGLAVGIDYALFLLVRYREERLAGASVLAAVESSGASAGHAVLFSGATVVVALAGLLLVPTSVFRGLAAGAIAVVLVAVLASLTLLPALLRLLGDRVDSGRLPLPRHWGDGQGVAARTARAAVRRPWLTLLVSVGLLGLLAAPALQMHIGFAGIETLPPQLETRQAFDRLQANFRIGSVADAVVVVDTGAGADGAAVDAALQRLRQAMAADQGFIAEHASERRSPDGRLRVLTVPLPGDAEGQPALEAIERLRSALVPQAFGGLPVPVMVTGISAGYLDFFNLTRQYAPLVIGLVLGLSFVLLTWAFRSVVVPLKAAALNLLSVGAAYGTLVLVFQHGVGAAWLGLQQVPIIEAWIPLFLFTVLYGLSMDYHVFLLSRVREHYDRTGDNADAVVQAVGSTAGVITGAALIMVAVFAGFATGQLVMFQQIGFGLAVAVLLDATLVRLLLVPASMTVLGDRNWYAPRWLGGHPGPRSAD